METSGKGSHRVFRSELATVSVPTSKKELREGTYKSIARKAGWE
jgi:predicted RNA binding protein YcfA (HicA-like mRNA interferase family)